MTPQTKAKLYGLYATQQVLINSNKVLGEVTGYQIDVAKLGAHTASYLLLTPLSQISNEDKITAICLHGFKNTNDFSVKVYDGFFDWDDGNEWGRVRVLDLNGIAIDFLRARGYALPITSIEDGKPITWSVEELVSEGVVKLKS